MNEQSQYSYIPKGDHLTIYKGKKKMHTPNGNVIIANSEAHAQRVIKELEAGADHTSCASVLCYHYTYCDLIAQFDAATIADDLQTCCRDNVIGDPLLFFRNDSATKNLDKNDSSEITEEMEEKIMKECSLELLKKMSSLINKCSINQLVAIIVVYCSFDSFALSWHIINMQQNNKDSLITELKQYCEDNEMECPDNIADIIDVFAYYYNLD